MIPNISVSIEEADNGYVIRPLSESSKAEVTRNAAVVATLEELRAWITEHFRRRACPKCGRSCLRSDSAWWFDRSVFRCRPCGMYTIDDADEWIEWRADAAQDSTGLYERLNEIARESESKNER